MSGTRRFLAFAAVGAVACGVYAPVLWCGFVEFDDPDYVYRNEVVRGGLSLEGVQYAFTSTELANWFPLTLLSHQVDASLYGLEPAGHHLTNVLLHALNSMLLLSVLYRASRSFGSSFAVALLFAVHPLHVESVAWVAERKDVLSVFFALAAIRFYLAYVNGPRPKLGYLAGVVCFALALMSKPVPVTLPFVLLLFDAWPLRRLDAGGSSFIRKLASLLIEKIPFFALTATSIGVTLFVQSRGGATTTLPDLAVSHRLSNAAISYWAYIGDTIWPAGLSPIYPHPRSDVSVVWGAIAAAGLALVSAAALASWRKRGYFTTGWFVFFGVLVPMIGLVQVGYQARADRYMYLPIAGLFLIVVWFVASWVGEHTVRRRFAGIALACAVVAYGSVTIRQIAYWTDSETLFQRALAVTDDNFFAHEELGLLRYREGRMEEAEFHYREALRLGPEAAALHANLSAIVRALGRPQDALVHAQRAIEMAPDESAAYGNLGWVLRDLGRPNESAQAFARAIELDAENAGAYYGMATLFAGAGQTSEALQLVEVVLRLEPEHERALQLREQLSGGAN